MLVALVVSALVACSPPASDPPETVGPVSIDTVPTTLLAEVVDSTLPDDSVVVPPGALFGGDLCTALEEADFTRVVIAGEGRGELLAFDGLSVDSCGYTVGVGDVEYTIVVQAHTADDFERPPTTDEVRDDVSGVGIAAFGVARGDTAYEVIVQVANGYFSVTTPDPASAKALAGMAAERAEPA